MENQQKDPVQPINLQKIDWNNLSVEEFQNLESTISERDKNIKASRERKKRVSNDKVPVILRGTTYMLTQVLATRLKEIKSQKSKDKLIDQIISENNPIMEI